jgi:hypothetical protein
MLYRSHYATLQRQERILKIKLSPEGFQTILSQGVPTSYNPDLFSTEQEWQRALQQGTVRYQWDPDRDLWLRRLDRRAIQLGVRGSVVKEYVNTWILKIEDVTELAHTIKAVIEKKQKEIPSVHQECVYEVNPQIQLILGMISNPLV